MTFLRSVRERGTYLVAVVAVGLVVGVGDEALVRFGFALVLEVFGRNLTLEGSHLVSNIDRVVIV